jgi:serine/threonine protein kinase
MITLEEIEKRQIIDFGHKCKVWLVSVQGSCYALKEVPKNDLNDMEVKHLFDEKQALTSLIHPNIIKLIATFKDEANLYFLLELARGAPLSYLIKQQRKFPLESVQSIVYQLAETLGHIHSQGFLYRDLKLSNVLLDINGKITLVDLGLCCKIEDKK